MNKKYNVIDLFSGAGGMSYGFFAHKDYKITLAVDAEIGKPSSGEGSLECNSTYEKNIHLRPHARNLKNVAIDDLIKETKVKSADVLIACAPCTGFSRAKWNNHTRDDTRNSLVVESIKFVRAWKPSVFIMENARELITGNFSYHHRALIESLEELGYKTLSEVHFLSEFGLPQKRERALIIATKKPLQPRSLSELFIGWKFTTKSITVRRAIEHLPPLSAGEIHPDDSMHISPSMTEINQKRLSLTPKDGGSWVDLLKKKGGYEMLIPSMRRAVDDQDLGCHPDVYGRLWWDRPSVTIKRECGNLGNGRYSHPEQNRLCSVRELALLQGFPNHYTFTGTVSNKYRHIGDAVPPLISYQIANLVSWILSGKKPDIADVLMPSYHLSAKELKRVH